MKAKDYADNFVNAILEGNFSKEAIKEATRIVFTGISKECADMIESRKPKTNDGVRVIIQDYNRKWNNISSLIEKQTGEAYFKPNAFLSLTLKNVPEIA